MIMCKSIQERIDEALEEGLELGFGRGDWERREETAVRMLKKGRLSLDEIAEYSAFPLRLVKGLKAELEAEERSRNYDQ